MLAIVLFIITFVMLLVIKGINKLKRKEEDALAGPTDNTLLCETIDLLKNNFSFKTRGLFYFQKFQ